MCIKFLFETNLTFVTMKRELIFKRLADFLKIAMVLSLVFYISSCDNNDDPDPTPEPDPGLEQAANDAGLTTLIAALEQANLKSALAGDEDLTIFAPTNDAFNAFLNEIGQDNLSDIPIEVLATVLQYHVIDAGSAITSGDLAPTQTVGTLAAEDLTITSDGNAVTLNPDTDDASVSTADVMTESGVVHVINKVLVPPTYREILGTIVEPAFFNINFTTLIDAVLAADPSVLTTLLDPNGTYTLFAPTNDAFTAAGITDLAAVTDVEGVLQYHLLTQEVPAADVINTDQATTANGEEIYISVVGSDVFINGTTQVTATDIAASNGIVHVINRTLIPPPGSIADIVTDVADGGAGEFTILLDLIGQAADLPDGTSVVDALSDADAEYTVFAPTDAAFNALPEGTLAGLSDVEIRDILLYHLVGDAVFSTDLADGGVTTVNGADITIDATNLTITDASGGTAGIEPGTDGELINILATNGVIHTIDAVLLP